MAVSSFSHLCTSFKLGCVASVRHTDFLPVELHSGCKGKLPVRHFISVQLGYILEEEIIKPHTFACSHFSIASSSLWGTEKVFKRKIVFSWIYSKAFRVFLIMHFLVFELLTVSSLIFFSGFVKNFLGISRDHSWQLLHLGWKSKENWILIKGTLGPRCPSSWRTEKVLKKTELANKKKKPTWRILKNVSKNSFPANCSDSVSWHFHHQCS